MTTNANEPESHAATPPGRSAGAGSLAPIWIAFTEAQLAEYLAKPRAEIVDDVMPEVERRSDDSYRALLDYERCREWSATR